MDADEMDLESHDERAPEDRVEHAAGSEDESEPEAPVDLMVTTRARRSNAGNRMSTLLAKSVEVEEEEWGEEWEDAPNEEEFQGDDVNEQDDYNMDSSSSEDDDEGGDEDDAGERELRKAERQEKSKKRKAATNPFAARVAAVTRKKVKLDVPHTQSPTDAPPRPKKKSERASWLPTEEDGPVRASARTQTVANKEATLSKLLEKDRRRDDTLAMMKAAEARKKKDEPKPLTQAERLAEAARNERINKKTLHRWEEAEEARAAERQAKIDALKNRQIQGPFIRYYSGPAIWVDDKIKYTGKDAPTIDQLEEKLNKEPPAVDLQQVQEETNMPAVENGNQEQSETPTPNEVPTSNGTVDNQSHPPQDPKNHLQISTSVSHMSSLPTSFPLPEQNSQPHWTPASQAVGGDVFMGSHGMPYPNSIMFAPPSQDSFLFGIDQYAQTQQEGPSDLPPNPFTQASPYNSTFATTQPPYSHQQHASLIAPLPIHHGNGIGPQALLQQFQASAAPPAPPRKKIIKRALRNLLILSSFPNLDIPPTRSKTPASLIKDKDRAALIQLSTTLFGWSLSEATSFVSTMLTTHAKVGKKAQAEREAALKPVKPLCAVTNAVARYRDPETGIAYRDARAFGVLRGVVGGGFVWSGDLGCYVGGRAKPLESMGGKGFLGMPPAKGVPRRFLEMQKKTVAPPRPVVTAETPVQDGVVSAPSEMEGVQQGAETVKTENVVAT
jgi:vacuolar protein sorting-associated protein 72